jgi:hypothetical protein
MKRTVFMTLAILAFVVSFSTLGVPRVHADITLHFEFPEPVVKKAMEIEGAQYYSLTMKGLPTYGDVGLPEFPLKPVRVLIPYGEDVENIEVSYGDKVKIEGAYAIMPAQQPVPTSYKGPYQPTLPDQQRVYSSIKAFPDTLSRHLSTQSKTLSKRQ